MGFLFSRCSRRETWREFGTRCFDAYLAAGVGEWGFWDERKDGVGLWMMNISSFEVRYSYYISLSYLQTLTTTNLNTYLDSHFFATYLLSNAYSRRLTSSLSTASPLAILTLKLPAPTTLPPLIPLVPPITQRSYYEHPTSPHSSLPRT